jgi:hypothetical protein
VRVRIESIAIVTALMQGGAYAQQLDCNRLRATAIPYELRLNQEIVPYPNPNGLKTVTRSAVNQVYRSESRGAKVTYAKQGDSPVTKTTGYGVLPIELSVGGQQRVRMEYKGIDVTKMLPEANYTFEQTIISEGREPATYSINRLVSEKKKIVLSNCSFDVIKYNSKGVDASGKLGTFFSEVEYMPQLQEIFSSKIHTTQSMTLMTFGAREISLEFKPLEQK